MTPRHPGGSDPSSSKPKLEGDPFVAPATPSSSTPGSVRKDKSKDDKRHQKKKHFYQKTKVCCNYIYASYRPNTKLRALF